MHNKPLKIFRKTRVRCNKWTCAHNNTGFCQKKMIELDLVTKNGYCKDYSWE